jgi:small-conductance mechanosensitive channel
MNELLNTLLSFGGSAALAVIVVISLYVNRWLFERIDKQTEKVRIVRRVIALMILVLGVLAFTITLPIAKALKEEIIGLIGIVLSAAFAFSSTTLIGNALAAMMNSNIKNFRLGDFVEIENTFGRVTNKGLFRTEIQTVDRNLTSLPNLYIANNPLKIMRQTGTIVSTTVSLGYDLNRSQIEHILVNAAKDCGLTEPFVYITNLGDFSVTYKISGLLSEIGKTITATYKLNAKVMDHLHKEGIEIVSPRFMNQRQVNEIEFIPKVTKEGDSIEDEKIPEEIVFDKAIKAMRVEEQTESLERIEKEIKKLHKASKDAKAKEEIDERIKTLEELKEKLKSHIVDGKSLLETE